MKSEQGHVQHSNVFYVDYLDFFVSEHKNAFPQQVWLRYDLLLFADSILCMSVPSCIKISQTADLLMQLTDFWNAKRLMLTMDKRHKKHPMRYFNSRKEKLERSMSEQKLLNHFEYKAYVSDLPQAFFGTFLQEVVSTGTSLYFDRKRDADICFRKAIITQVNSDADKISRIMPISYALSLGSTFNELLVSAQNRSELFQRTLIMDRVHAEIGAGDIETRVMESVLDRGFAYANAVASESIPLSLVRNQFTGRTLSRLIYVIDKELFDLINGLYWPVVFQLSNHVAWKALIYYINMVLYTVQLSKRNQDKLLSIRNFNFSLSIYRLVAFVYNYVVDNIAEEMIKTPFYFDFKNAKQAFEETVDCLLENKMPYINYLREIERLLPTVKTTVKLLKADFPAHPQIQQEKGYIFALPTL